MKKLHVLTISRRSLLLLLTILTILLLSVLLFHSGFRRGNVYRGRDLVPVTVLSKNGIIAEKSPGTLKNGVTEAVGTCTADTCDGGKLAIIIDDFGSSRDGVEKMMSIREHLTFAVMPFLQNTLEDAEIAHGNGFEVIVHLSMEPNYGKRSWLGPNPILSGMEEDKVGQIVRDAFDSVPYAEGANIHMGSKASNDEGIMSAVLDVIKENGTYFVDSRTASKPKAKKLSVKKGVLCYERDVFIDEQQPKGQIKERLAKAAEIALQKGYAIAAGHVGQEGGDRTADAILEMLPAFKEKKIELVYVSELNEGILLEQ